MATVKTAISLQEPLFKKVEAVASTLSISRSRFFALAAEAFIKEYENRQLLEQINAAYEDGPDPEEQELRRRWRRKHRQLAEGEWYPQGMI